MRDVNYNLFTIILIQFNYNSQIHSVVLFPLVGWRGLVVVPHDAAVRDAAAGRDPNDIRQLHPRLLYHAGNENQLCLSE